MRDRFSIDLPSKYKWLILSLLFLTILVAFMGRLSTSVALEEIGEELVWSRAEQGFLGGVLMGIFLIPYGFSNIFFSPNIDKYGPKMILVGSMTGCSVAVFLGAFFGDNYILFLLSRVLLGLSQGVMFPIATKVIAGWFSKKTRGRANSIFMIGAPVGISISPILMGPIIHSMGWRYSFYLIALFGFLLVIPIFLFITDNPSERRTNQNRKKNNDMLEAFKRLFKDRDFQQITVGFTAVNTVFWGTSLWIPSYLEHTTGLNLGNNAYLAAIPYLGSILGMLIGSWVSDVKGNTDGIIMFSLLTSGLMIIILTFSPVEGAMMAIFLLFLVFLTGQLAPPLFFTKLQNSIRGDELGSATGLMNGIANTFGVVGPVSVGIVIALTGAYTHGLIALSVIAFAGLVGFERLL
ncbi:MAG: MFS transporter [Candidatus Thermoplasmatota archaeon]|nr:MFS transporter [Candidatus Thermoplasmatota archaeon]MBS3789650.1 MFS transporter [Candidatus Thermoplasmatota archaeon]